MRRKLILAGLLALLVYVVPPTLAEAYLPAPTLTSTGTKLEWTPAAGPEEATTKWQLCKGGPESGDRFVGDSCEFVTGHSRTYILFDESDYYSVKAEEPEQSYFSNVFIWHNLTYPMGLGLNAGGEGAGGIVGNKTAQVVRLGCNTDEYDLPPEERTLANLKANVKTEDDRWAAKGVGIIDTVEGSGVCRGTPSEAKNSTEAKELEIHSISPTKFAEEVVEEVEANPEVYAVEVLNEPGGGWFWEYPAEHEKSAVAEDTANVEAYAVLVKDTREALNTYATKTGHTRPLVLASYDGGHNNSSEWGEKVWAAAAAKGFSMKTYVDAVTVHPYGGPSGGEELPGKGEYTAAEGDRPLVVAAHEKAELPVDVTEVGWEVGTGKPSEKEQATDYESFGKWAAEKGYVPAVTFFAKGEGGAKWAAKPEAIKVLETMIGAGL